MNSLLRFPRLLGMMLVTAGFQGVSNYGCAESTNASSTGPAPYSATEDVPYGYKDGLALTLDILRPNENARNIGVILVSSGSWKSNKSAIQAETDRARRTEHWVQGLLRGGYTLFVARHGSRPRYRVPEMIEDIRRSVRFVRLHATDYGVDPVHIGITSGSSGGHLALMVGLSGDDGNPESKDPVERVNSRVQAIVAWFPPTDLINFGAPDAYKNNPRFDAQMFGDLFGKVTDLAAQLKSISPIYFVNSQSPPLLLLHGDRDAVVPVQQSEVMRAKYEESGRPVHLIIHAGGGHSYWPGILNDYPAVWEWFDRHLKP